MPFGIATKTPEQKAAERSARELRRAAERMEYEQRQAQLKAEREERAAIEREDRKRRFEAFPEFIVREIREVTVKAANESDAKMIAEAAFKKGQNEDTYSVRPHLRYDLEGNTIDKIRRVTVKVARFFD